MFQNDGFSGKSGDKLHLSVDKLGIPFAGWQSGETFDLILGQVLTSTQT